MEKGIVTEFIEITNEELSSLTNAIFQRHGIDFGCYEPMSLKRRVARSLNVFKMGSIHELWIKILREPGFIYPFMDEISVGLTALFRDPILWKSLEKKISEKVACSGKMSVWHAGCSTGEEVYSLGILLKLLGVQNVCTARATDISMQAMETAKKGSYHKMKWEEYRTNFLAVKPFENLESYLTIVDDPDTFRFNKGLVSHVKWEYHNLVTGDFDAKYDIIFCRNVMIYFDSKTKIKLFEKFHQSLNPGGMLIVGFYDAVLPLIDGAKFMVHDIDAKIFRRID